MSDATKNLLYGAQNAVAIDRMEKLLPAVRADVAVRAKLRKAIHQEYVNGGFSDSQAFELLMVDIHDLRVTQQGGE